MSKRCGFAKSALVIIFLLVLSRSSIAQFIFGVGGGINVANIDQKIVGSDKLVGLNIGVKVNYQPNKKYLISTFPSFSEKGSVISSFDTLGNRYDAVFDFKYIDLTITFVPIGK